MNPNTRTKLATAVALAFIATPLAVRAQQAAEEKTADGKPAQPHLETINVSAERVTGFKARTSQIGAFRDAEILDIPMTINVIPRTPPAWRARRRAARWPTTSRSAAWRRRTAPASG